MKIGKRKLDILALLAEGPKHFYDDLGGEKSSKRLLELELDGLIRRLPGWRYELRPDGLDILKKERF